jgi:hypothetical protein
MRSVSAILIFILPVLACSSGSQINPHAGKMIVPGRGTDEVQVGMSRQQVIDMLGEPADIQENGRWLSYQEEYSLGFRFDNLDRVSEIHFLAGFKGRLPSRIQIGSKTLDVFQAYGSPLERREVPAGSDDGEDRVLYILPEGYRITYHRPGLALRFSPVKRVTRIIVFQPLPDRNIRIKPVEPGDE